MLIRLCVVIDARRSAGGVRGRNAAGGADSKGACSRQLIQ